MKKKRTNRMLLETEDEEQRYGTKFEDMYWIDPKSVTIIAKEIESCAEGKFEYAENVISKIQKYNNLITLHSHPNSFPPSIKDLNSNFHNHYDIGIIVCRDGKIFVYSSKQEINEDYYKLKVEKYLKNIKRCLLLS